MKGQDYFEIYAELGIQVEPLPENYSPDDYGRQLLTGSLSQVGVSYSSTTEILQDSQQQQSYYSNR